MNNIRLNIKRIAFLSLLMILYVIGYGQDIQFVGATKNMVAVGEQFRLVYSLNAKGTNFKAPSMETFAVLMGPSTSQSTSMQIINGQMSQSVNFSYTYILQATTEGKYTFNPAEITIDGKIYKSNEITIEVVKGNVNSNQQSNQNNQNQVNNNTISNDDIFVRVNLNKTNVYQGEQIVATISIYTKLNLVGFEDMKFPSFKGFWSDDIENPSQIQLKQEKYNGSIYNVGVLKKTLLTPQHSGDIIIEPFDLTCVVQQRVNRSRQSFFDDFFGNYQNVRKKLISPQITVHVKALPGNKPASFNGAVGSFTLQANLDRDNVKMNEAIAYSIKLSGTGNIKLAELPEIKFHSDFEQYDPKTSNNITAGANGTSGSKTINYLLIPRHWGDYTIPSVSFSYFDIKSQSYKTLTTPDFRVHVEKDSVNSSTAIVSEFSKEDVKFLGSDIHFIKTNKPEFKKKGTFLISEPLFYMGYPLSLGLFMFIIYWRRKQIKQNADIASVKNRKANKVAQKRLQLSNKYLKENKKDEFYEEMTRALWGYLSDKLMIPISDLSKESASKTLNQKGIQEDIILQLSSIIDTCEFARYSPVSDNSEMNEIYNNATELIGKLENNLR